MARNCGVRRHLHPCVSEQQRTRLLQGAPSLPVRAPRLAMPTEQAHMTRARCLHATRSNTRSDNDTSSLPERRIACRFFLFRWHRHVPPPKCQDSDLHRQMVSFPGAYVLRALSWVHVPVWGAAGRGCHTPAWPGSARFAHSSYVNRALFGISTSADRWPPCWRCMPRVPYHGHMCASGEPLEAATGGGFTHVEAPVCASYQYVSPVCGREFAWQNRKRSLIANRVALVLHSTIRCASKLFLRSSSSRRYHANVRPAQAKQAVTDPVGEMLRKNIHSNAFYDSAKGLHIGGINRHYRGGIKIGTRRKISGRYRLKKK